jgi:hypothetical protein
LATEPTPKNLSLNYHMRTMVLLAAHIWRTQQRYRPTASTTIRILFPSFFQLEDDQQTQRRHFSSRKRNNNSFQLDAVPFRVSPQEAYTQFQHWADKEQGLGPFLNIGGPIGSAAISAAYTPFWYFDLNIRFVPPSSSSSGSSRRDNRTNYGSNFIPEPFKSAYPNAPNGIIHVPGLASYAGFWCDSSVSVSGTSHSTIFSDSAEQSNQVFRGASSFLSQKAMPLAGTAVQFFGDHQTKVARQSQGRQ